MMILLSREIVYETIPGSHCPIVKIMSNIFSNTFSYKSIYIYV
jgi:hypothetical protein